MHEITGLTSAPPQPFRPSERPRAIVGFMVTAWRYFEPPDLVRMGAWLTIVEFVILLLLVPFYWPLIGIH
jgi:hypothetical protein